MAIFHSIAFWQNDVILWYRLFFMCFLLSMLFIYRLFLCVCCTRDLTEFLIKLFNISLIRNALPLVPPLPKIAPCIEKATPAGRGKSWSGSRRGRGSCHCSGYAGQLFKLLRVQSANKPFQLFPAIGAAGSVVKVVNILRYCPLCGREVTNPEGSNALGWVGELI